MEYIHESVKKDHYYPARLFISGVRSVQRHWHNSVEVLLFLEGKVALEQAYTNQEFSAGDFVIINSNEVHSLHAITPENIVLTLQLPKPFFTSIGIDIGTVYFDYSSQQSKIPEVFALLKSLLAEMALTDLQKEKYYTVKLGELTHRFAYLLSLYFAVPRVDEVSQRELDRLSLAITEIQENYRENLTLQNVGEVQGLSRNYFAQYFKKHMGITFLEYLNSIRLEHAHNELIQTDKNITAIALDNGFPNSKSFSKIFKDVFKDTPSVYRRKYLEGSTPRRKSMSSMSYFDIVGESNYPVLYSYLLPDKENPPLPSPSFEFTRNINTAARGKIFAEKPQLLTFGRAATGLSSALQAQLIAAQSEIGFGFARFHGILDDDMAVYREDSHGEPVFNFFYVNQLVDFLLSINLRPFLELSFMPSGLAKTKYSLWDGKSYLSMPKDMAKWNGLIKALLKNFIARYGASEVANWKFEVWNEPEYFGIMWNDSANDYYRLWENTYKTIKSVSPSISVGGPTSFISTVCGSDWFTDFVTHCKKTNTSPDFISVHFYPVDGLNYDLFREEMESSTIVSDDFDYQELNENMGGLSRDTGIKLSDNPDELYDSYKLMKIVLQKKGWNNLPIYLTEWNHTTWQRDLVSDTTFKSAYLVKNTMDNLGTFEALGYWTISDLMEEMPLAEEMFHGGLGLITTGGIPKPGFYALSLLSRLGDVLIEKGDYYAVFKSDAGIQVLMYYYTHINELYQKFDTSHIHPTNRYNVFKEKNNIDIRLTLAMKNKGLYRIKETRISRESGSVYDKWLAMGAPPTLTTSEQEQLKGLSVPVSHISYLAVEDKLKLAKVLTPLEVVLFEIERDS